MFSTPIRNPETWKHEKKNCINNKAKILKPNFIADEDFQILTDQDVSYSGIFPIALLYLFENLRMLLNWLLAGLTISKTWTFVWIHRSCPHTDLLWQHGWHWAGAFWSLPLQIARKWNFSFQWHIFLLYNFSETLAIFNFPPNLS